MKVGFIVAIVGLLLTSCNEKKLQTDIWFAQSSEKDVVEYESKIPGEEIPTIVAKEARQFLRQTNEELPLKTRYYFKGGVCNKVIYEWSKVVPGLEPQELDSLMTAEANNMKVYSEKFDQIAQSLSEKYGVPVSGDGHLKKERFEMLDMWKRDLKWKQGNQNTKLSLVWVPKIGYRIFKVFVETTWED